MQSAQDLCNCNRGMTVEYQCSQDNCQIHYNEPYFCDLCLEGIQTSSEPHSYQAISEVMEAIQIKWKNLMHHVDHLFTQATAQYDTQRALIETFDSFSKNITWFEGRNISNDMIKFKQFHNKFNNYLIQNDEKIKSQNIRLLQPTVDSCLFFQQALDRDFSYLKNIGNSDFIYKNYAACILDCPISFRVQDSEAREQILAMKVKLGSENIASQAAIPIAKINSADVLETLSKLRSMVIQQGTQICAFASLVGNLEGVAKLVSICINSQREEGTAQKLEKTSQDLRRLDADLKDMTSRFDQLNFDENRQNERHLELINSSVDKRLSHVLKKANEELKELEQQMQSYVDRSLDTRMYNMQCIIQANLERTESNFIKFKEQIDVKTNSIIDSVKIEIKKQEEKKFIDKSKIKILDSPSSFIDANPLYATAQKEVIPYPKDTFIGATGKSLRQQNDFRNAALLKPNHNRGSSDFQLLSLQYNAPAFSQDELDQLIETFNKPFKGYDPKLNERGQSKLAEFIAMQRWNWPIEWLNSKADSNRKAQKSNFEGADRGKGWPKLKEGIFYGQMLNGKRDGYGIVYSIDSDNNPWLYECEWSMGLPTNEGRYVWILNNQWRKAKGTINQNYLMHGIGCRQDEDGFMEKGEYNQGDCIASSNPSIETSLRQKRLNSAHRQQGRPMTGGTLLNDRVDRRANTPLKMTRKQF
ncbi:hypothetical protein FGO68_gene14805 [Halteria grandinella]|uniref:Uncharacterized protein n=1 Tax=Halteria grandinella TaxID=5974 RepID=A0A8J8NV56_HALGN|nr:hypothetical protein FGO68_gene14805 [Halteria grandinella]